MRARSGRRSTGEPPPHQPFPVRRASDRILISSPLQAVPRCRDGDAGHRVRRVHGPGGREELLLLCAAAILPRRRSMLLTRVFPRFTAGVCRSKSVRGPGMPRPSPSDARCQLRLTIPPSRAQTTASVRPSTRRAAQFAARATPLWSPRLPAHPAPSRTVLHLELGRHGDGERAHICLAPRRRPLRAHRPASARSSSTRRRRTFLLVTW